MSVVGSQCCCAVVPSCSCAVVRCALAGGPPQMPCTATVARRHVVSNGGQGGLLWACAAAQYITGLVPANICRAHQEADCS